MLSSDLNSEAVPPSLSRRAMKAALWSAAIVIAWIAFHLIEDRCWVYFRGTSSVVAAASLLFASLFVFFLLQWKARIVFAILMLFLLALLPLENNRVAAAKSRAASLLRATAMRLEEYRDEAPNHFYPSTLAVQTDSHNDRYYRYSYIPLHSRDNSRIDGFLVVARPSRYSCGLLSSFTVGSDGRIHRTQEDREASLNDPVLN